MRPNKPKAARREVTKQSRGGSLTEGSAEGARVGVLTSGSVGSPCLALSRRVSHCLAARPETRRDLDAWHAVRRCGTESEAGVTGDARARGDVGGNQRQSGKRGILGGEMELI